MQIVWTILLGILVFGLMVFVHELGHFLCAKAAGVKVNEFAIGMGPTLFKWGKGETRYALRAFPIGGFVSMEGEEGPEEAETEQSAKDGKELSEPVQSAAVTAPEAAADIPSETGKPAQSGEGRSFYEKPIWKRMLIIVAGAFMNVLLGFILLLIVTSMKSAIASRTISYFDDAAVSNAEGGLQLGDEIVSLNGKAVNIGNDISYGLIRDEDGIVDFEVIRDGERIKLSGVKFDMYASEEGTNSIVLDFKVQPMDKNFFTVIRESFYWTFSIIDLVWGSLIDLVTGHFTLNDLSGPVGVVTVIGEAASVSFDALLLMVGMITINIGVFNLLPIPALDGGRFLFLIFELIFRKPVPHKVEGIVNAVGFGLLMLLMIVVTVNDIVKLF